MAGQLRTGVVARRTDEGEETASLIRWRRALLLAVVLAIFSSPGTAQAEILTAELRVNGLACPFCAFGIEKKVLDVDGVESVEVLLAEGLLRLRLRRGNGATVRDLERAVEKAGFELADLTVEVRGRLEARGADTWLEAHGELRLRLLQPDGDRSRPLSPAARERLGVDDEGLRVASGRVLRRAGEEPDLVIDLSGAREGALGLWRIRFGIGS